MLHSSKNPSSKMERKYVIHNKWRYDMLCSACFFAFKP